MDETRHYKPINVKAIALALISIDFPLTDDRHYGFLSILSAIRHRLRHIP